MHIQRRGDDHRDRTLYSGARQIGIEWYFRNVTELPTSMMMYRLDPGAEEGEHFHLADDSGSCSVVSEDEIYLVVSGQVVMTVRDERAVLRPGEAVYVPEGVPHSVKNESDEPVELVLLFGPGTGNPLRSASPGSGAA